MDKKKQHDLYLTKNILQSLAVISMRLESLSNSIKKEAALIKASELKSVVELIKYDALKEDVDIHD